MATIKKLPSGRWRVQVRRRGQYASQTFLRKADADTWAIETEHRIDRGDDLTTIRRADASTFGDLIDIHIADLLEVGKPIRRSKDFSLRRLKSKLGHLKLSKLTRERLIQFGKERAREGAGPVTLSSDFSYIGTIITHAAAVHGLNVSKEPVTLARTALNRLGLVGKSNERDRRPTKCELDRLVAYFDSNPRQVTPVGRIICFAVATAMRQEEICTIRRVDLDPVTRTQLVRNRKDPRRKNGNHQRVPLLDLTGYDAWAIVQQQMTVEPNSERIFPYNPKSVGTAFRRACKELGIDDLHFHDLRHEATSRLFEAGLKLQEVALVTGHRDWKMLRRYTHLRPEQLTARHQPKSPVSAPQKTPQKFGSASKSPWSVASS